MNREQYLQCLEDVNKRLGKFGFAKGKYVVLAGGAMMLHDPYVEELMGKSLRKTTRDVDLSVNPEVYNKLKAALEKEIAEKNKGAKKEYVLLSMGVKFHPAGFKQHERIVLNGVHGDVELSAGGRSIIGRTPVNIDGHHVQSLEDILDFKRKLGRPKDQADIDALLKVIEPVKLATFKAPFVRKDITFVKKTNDRKGRIWKGNY